MTVLVHPTRKFRSAGMTRCKPVQEQTFGWEKASLDTTAHYLAGRMR